ncbi:RcnB family protein [Sphingomonas sp.]|uniref:RcnB family protein n=1 Tax=Sphingomonas sp. TaxID=28214 RepID=UPI0031DAD828
MRIQSPLVALCIALGLNGPALAQARAAQAGASYPRPGFDPAPTPVPQPVVTTTSSLPIQPGAGSPRDRWGSKVGGRWWGGANAPGGWRTYRRPERGMVLPAYWNSPRFGVSDWAVYSLPQPPVGYHWTRYYDDAVLIDQRGAVYDSVDGIDWDGLGAPAYAGAYPPRPPSIRGDGRGDTGLGGAAIGAVAGGVAGNLIAGRGNRLGGTLIGAGVGAAAGYAIDRAEDRRRHMPPGQDDYGRRDYGRPDYGYPDAYAPPPPPPAMGRRIVTRDGTTVTTTTTVGTLASGSSGYYDGGYYYPAPTVTTVVVQGAPVITTSTTTTTEIVRTAPSRARGHRVRSKLVRR